MDALLQAHFARVETALGTLVESIATYNPSTQAALDLVTADDELSEGLDQLSYHQANHARIIALRAEAEALEIQLKSSVTTLANLRHELFQTPATTFSDDSRPVPVNELLAYARKIASHTVPPTYRELAPPKADKDKEGAEGASGGASTQGVGTPANAATSTEPAKEAAEGENGALKEVTEEQAEWVQKLHEAGFQWTPWPNNSKIWNGNLMQIQRNLLDFKKDPWKERADVVVEGEAMEETGRPEQVEEPKMEPAAPAPVRRESVVARPPVEEKPRQQFNLFDFDEEED